MEIAKIFLFVKDEKYLIQKWLPYYKSIFGENNIYILDHGSEDGTLDIINSYKVKVHDCRNHPFKDKHILLTKLMSQYKKECKFLIPTDADEFLLHIDQNYDCNINKQLILDTLENHKIDLKSKLLELRSVLEQMEYSDPLNQINLFRCLYSPLSDNHLIDESFKKTSRWHSKTFYPADKFINTDQGNHCGKILGKNYYNYISLGFFHFQYLGYEHWKWKNTRGINAYNMLKDGKLPERYGGAGSKYYHQVNKEESWFRDNHITVHQRNLKARHMIRTDVFKDYISALD